MRASCAIVDDHVDPLIVGARRHLASVKLELKVFSFGVENEGALEPYERGSSFENRDILFILIGLEEVIA